METEVMRKTSSSDWLQVGTRLAPADLPSGPLARPTLADWREPRWSPWSFQHVRELVPSAEIRAGRPSPLERDRARAIAQIEVPDALGGAQPFGDLLRKVRAGGLVALRGGRLAGEYYSYGLTADRPHIIFSVSKSVTGLLAGILADRGALDPDAPVTDYVPEVAGSAYDGARLRDVLDMTVSTAFEESYLDRTGDYGAYRIATAWNPVPDPARALDLHEFLTTMRPGDGPHGAAHRYISPNSDLLGWVLERAAGMPYAALCSALLWQPMGAACDAYVTLDRKGAARSAGGICAGVRDMARLGEMVRLGGIAAGRAVIPGWWIDDMWSGGNAAAWAAGDNVELMASGRYRSQWYVPDGPSPVLFAVGIHGQWIWIDAEREIVIAMVSAQPEPEDHSANHAIMAAFRAVAAALA